MQTIGIIGNGHFGAFLARVCATCCPTIPVRMYSSRMEPDGATFFSLVDVCMCDVVIPCVPIAAYAETMHRIAPLLGKHTVVCDVATVKTHTIAAMRSAGIPRFVATHPMFGPESFAKRGSTLTGLRIVISESTLPDDQLTHWIGVLQSVGLDVIRMNADTHDTYLASSLFLTHLVGQSVNAAHIIRTPIDTLSFGFLMDAVESVAPDTALFTDVYRYNPYCTDVAERYAAAVTGIVEKIRKNNR